ncbi:helix-turn-helix transcriptional regulator [Amycolatopsis sp. EV170708-02-1]|uniref:ArsR/SmtB family transcription factor n=1 Tax=Amycolatopsis sp. EV170708-02-1 TaxID=2919322 RepID=UPI001F0B91FE|nr:winged helix-turn-helix domain-containing protein [Amycolatopsis sp. EV170708-02-1]UMP01107.1 winged helix-turn-helix domain-containing protein [Amycolatopsis sp. EV170708-02-1]
MHFSGEDLGRVRVATRPDPLWETTLSLHRLQRGDGGLAVRKWRGTVRSRLPKAAGPLLTLVPPSGYFPDFLTPSGEDLEEQLDLLCGTKRCELRRDLAILARSRRPTPWARDLGDANPAALGALTRAIRSYHHAAIEPVWNDILACFDRQRARQARILLADGVEGLLRGLSPAMRWKAPVLEADYPVHQDLHLDGRGLLLVPSYFCWRTGVTLVENDQVPVLVHPIEGHVPATVHPDHATALSVLLGHTRAAVLETIEGGGRTSDVARRAGISISSASQHATVLREAGLVLSTREGNTVRHHLTQLGSALLRKNL